MPKNFSTVAHPDIVKALKEAAESLKVRHHLGWIFTTDALFQETPELIQELNEQQISGIDMVTSTFLTIAQVAKKKGRSDSSGVRRVSLRKVCFSRPAISRG